MARYRTYSIEFKREVVRQYLAGDISLHGLAKQHRICRNLIRLWLAKYEAGEFNEEAAMAASLEECEAGIAGLERTSPTQVRPALVGARTSKRPAECFSRLHSVNR
jgi:transposase